LFARAVKEISGGPGNGTTHRFSAAALEGAYLRPLRKTHYYKNVQRLADWPGYIERTQIFFERQLDVVNGSAFILSRPELPALRRWWEWIRLLRRTVPLKRLRSVVQDLRRLSASLRVGHAIRSSLAPLTLGRWLLNTVTALIPSRRATTGGDETTGLAKADSPQGGQLRAIFRVLGGSEAAGRLPWLLRWYWGRFGRAIAAAFADVYTNDNEPLDGKLPRALGRLIDTLSIWDLAVALLMGAAAGVTAALQFLLEWFQYFVLRRDLSGFREQLVSRYQDDTRSRLRLDDQVVEVNSSYEAKLGTISYREGQHSHIKVLWPENLTERGRLASSALWSICPAKVYELYPHPRGIPGVVVNFDNCIKCESCWRATPDVHWSRATRQRFIYETYTPAHRQLRDVLLSRREPIPRLRKSPGYWQQYWQDVAGGLGGPGGASKNLAEGIEPTRSKRVGRDGTDVATALAAVEANLEAFTTGLQAYGDALAATPMALEQGQRRHLSDLLEVAADRFEAARQRWQSDRLAALREAIGDRAAAFWSDAAAALDDLLRHAAADHFFWAGVYGQQLADHHVAGFRVLLDILGAQLPEPAAAASGLPSEPSGARSWAVGWRAVEGHRQAIGSARERIRGWCEEHLHSRAVRSLEEGEPLTDAQRQWLRCELATSVAAADGGRAGSELEGGGRQRWRSPDQATTPTLPLYGVRDALLEELAAHDPSIAYLASQHLLACDLVGEVAVADAGAQQPTRKRTKKRRLGAGADDIATELFSARELAAVVHQGNLDSRPAAARSSAKRGKKSTAARGVAVELRGTAPLVPMALADWLLVVVGNKGYLVPVDDPGLKSEEVGSIGLLGAGFRRLSFEGCRVAANRIVDVAAGSGLDGPAAGEPCADIVAIAVHDQMAIIRGAGDYLLGRARDHAANRIQFPGAFEDEAGRDTIAKFGAVKQMLAEMESQRALVEALTLIDPGPAADPWIGAAVRKVATAAAFGPGEGSFSYNGGQVFGGTAYSEDDVISKYYRDSSPFRFLLAHDDALRVEIGGRRLQAVREGDSLIPIAAGERAWLDEVRDHGPLADVVPRWEVACEAIERWAAGAADQTAAASLPPVEEGEATAAGSQGAQAEQESDLVQPLCHLAGEAVVRALAVKVCILRAAWRLEGGLPSPATLEATRLLADRWAAEAPAMVEEAALLAEVMAVGDDTIAHGDFEPAPQIEDAESYQQVITSDHSSRSGDWLVRPFNASLLRYVPEHLWNDADLGPFRGDLEKELRQRFVGPRFDGLTYNRYLEKLHTIPRKDLDYLIERGFLRMPIPRRLGGEEAQKAVYYILCEMTGRYGDAALSLVIMANTSIGTTPMLIGLKQDLPRARAELEKVRDDPRLLGELRQGLEALIVGLARPDLAALQEQYLELTEPVKKRILRSSVLKYIGGGFLRSFFAAGQAGEQRDLAGFGEHLEAAGKLLEQILDGVDERLAEYPRRERAHELFLKMISAGYISAFALTEPTAGSDSGGVKTNAKLKRRQVFEDQGGVLYFYLDEEGQKERRNLLDADRLEFDFDGHRMHYRYADDAEAAEICHDGYDYEKDRGGHWRSYRHRNHRVEFTDIAQIRSDGDGHRWYEFWELNGAKMWITNGRFAGCFALYARTEPEGVTGFMVDRHAEGLTVGADEEKLGQRGSPTNELSLNGVRVPRECIIGFRGRGQVNALETLNTGRAGLGVTTRATIQEMVEDAVPLLQGEEPAPRPLERYWMGRLTEELLATSSLSSELIGLLDHARTEGVRMESAIGKYYGSEAEHDGIDWMERLQSLEGQTHLHRIEKTRRDARVLNIYEGTNEVQRFLLLRDLVKRVLPASKKGAGEVTGGNASQQRVAHPDLRDRLEEVKARLIERLDDAVQTFGDAVADNVSLQPCFFRLAEIAGLTKVMDALLYRLE
ncbi:MAG: acyl-CoA dehydrogenase family protein, partial [Acidobacteriota bacterium]